MTSSSPVVGSPWRSGIDGAAPFFSPARSAGVLHGDAFLAARELMKSMFQDFKSTNIAHFRLKVENRFLLIKFHSPVQKLPDGRPLVSVSYLDSLEALAVLEQGAGPDKSLSALEDALTGGAQVKEVLCTAEELNVFIEQLQSKSHAVHPHALEGNRAPGAEGTADERTALRASVLCLPIYSAATKLNFTASS